MFFQVPSQVFTVGHSMRFSDLYCWVAGIPDSSAAAATIGLKVDPGWKPLPPPIAASTLRLTTVWFLLVSRPYGRVWAIARILPLPGSIMVAAADTGSVTYTSLVTAFCAAACLSGSRVV